MEIEQFHEINITKENIFSPSISQSLQNIINNEGFVTHKVFKRHISTAGGNFLGNLFEVDIKGKTPDEEKELHLFVKKSLKQTTDFLTISCAYEKEQLFYDELTKVFEELEDEYRVPEAERLRTLKGYKVSSLDAIIMENLRKQGYTTLHRMEVFSLEFAEMAIKQLATFHGLTFILKEKKPEYYNSTVKKISKSVFDVKKMKEILQNIFDIAKSNLEGKWQNKLEPCFSKLSDEFLKSFDTHYSPMNCLCHGDYRQNNILIKTINGKILDLIPIDYQFLHIGNPLNDFFYFVYTGSDKEFRKAHLNELKNLYYDTLINLFHYFDMDVEDIYSREKFEEDFKNRRVMGLAFATLFYPTLFVNDEEVPSFECDDWSKINLKVDPRYLERTVGVLEEYDELGYFLSSQDE